MRFSIATSLFAACLVISLHAVADPLGKSAAFQMPINVDNWETDILGHNGMYRFVQTDGNCQITFAQNRGADAARAAGRTPQNSLDAYINSIATEIGEVTRSEAPAVELRLVADEKVTFATAEITYTGKDNVAYHNRISTQWVDDVELLIVAACPSSDWNQSQNLLDSFLDKVSITNTTAP